MTEITATIQALSGDQAARFVLALQTEAKLSRQPGQVAFTVHKRPLRDSTLGQVITKLISTYLPGGK